MRKVVSIESSTRFRRCRATWLTEEQFAALCASPEPYGTLWRLMAAHKLRLSGALALAWRDVADGCLFIRPG
jgi:integrase